MSNDQPHSSLSVRWTSALVSMLGTLEILMAFDAGSALTRAVGIVGGLALAATPWVARRTRGVSLLLLVAGTVPFALLTLTSLVTPMLAMVAWILMGFIYRHQTRPELSIAGTSTSQLLVL